MYYLKVLPYYFIKATKFWIHNNLVKSILKRCVSLECSNTNKHKNDGIEFATYTVRQNCTQSQKRCSGQLEV